MFYVPLSLFLQTEPCIVRGPKFKRAKALNINIGGTEIRFRAPRNQGSLHIRDPFEPRSSHFQIPSPQRSLPGAPPSLSFQSDKLYKGWKLMTLMARFWRFNGPNFTGRRAKIEFSIDVVKADKPEGTSYFHPRILETAILDRMAVYYGLAGPGDQDWLVPSGWKALSHFPCPAVSFVAKMISRYNTVYDNRYYAIFPIHDDYFIEVRFATFREPVWVDGKRQENIENWIPIAPLEELIQQVIASFEVKLSPEAQAQMQRAHSGLNDTSLVKEFAPINIEEYLKNASSAKSVGRFRLWQ